MIPYLTNPLKMFWRSQPSLLRIPCWSHSQEISLKQEMKGVNTLLTMFIFLFLNNSYQATITEKFSASPSKCQAENIKTTKTKSKDLVLSCFHISNALEFSFKYCYCKNFCFLYIVLYDLMLHTSLCYFVCPLHSSLIILFFPYFFIILVYYINRTLNVWAGYGHSTGNSGGLIIVYLESAKYGSLSQEWGKLSILLLPQRKLL